MHINTPLLVTDPSFSAAGRPLFLKMDALQPSGSFKMRGIGHFCRDAVEKGATGIVCASGGNAGIAAALAARTLGVPATVFVPDSTTADVRARIAATGAEIHVAGRMFDETDGHARAHAAANGAAYVHPFDHPLLWEGHATLIDEVVAAGADFDCVVLSVGGGGLLAGVVEGLRRNGLGEVPVIAVETEGAASLAESLATGTHARLPAITSIATSLGAAAVAPHVLSLTESHPIVSVTVSDADAVDACLSFADRMRVLVEPACGATLAVADRHAGLLARHARPLIVVCGGINVSIAKLLAWKAQFG